MKLEDLQPDSKVRGIAGSELSDVVSITWHGADALTLVYRTGSGNVAEQILFREDESRLSIVSDGRRWSFDGDGAQFRLAAEAQRIRLAHLFDSMLAVQTSLVEPLPHQITAVYESMLPRQPLRFLLADDPGAGKTIMAGLLIKELIYREDVKRCLVVCPGNLVEQWQDELFRKFGLDFEIMTNDKFESARTGNWFLEHDLAITRLDKLARNEDVQAKLSARECRYDLIICDEAHKMSASYFGGEIKRTKRYSLGQKLSQLTRHFLLMTATPHNGKEEDFQLFLALLDPDRFEGKFRDGVHQVDTSDLMRRMVKEKLLKFDGRPLFPERKAYTVPYKLSRLESELYEAVTDYVRKEFDRAQRLQNNKRAGTVGFALTVLQRRLASSPEAIYQSIERRKGRLEDRLAEMKSGRSAPVNHQPSLDVDDLEDLEDAPGEELENTETIVLDQATAASTIGELESEIRSLSALSDLAARLRRSGEDSKWSELSELFEKQIFTSTGLRRQLADDSASYSTADVPRPKASPHQKLVIFTEHRDTLNYLERRIRALLGRSEAVVLIYGGLKREQRRQAQESFLHDPAVQVLIATDAAGEGINLQRAHLMVNYDLPWNPNRIEQRFGRIHRIGQVEVCHLWNLVAEETREGDVFRRLLDKLEQARHTLGGQVFDVLGKIQFEGKSLRELLVEAVRYGDSLDVRQKLDRAVSDAVDQAHLRELINDHALVQEAMDMSRVKRAREDLERAEARKLQPYYIESFFLEAFKSLGGSIREREPRRYQINRVPATMRNRHVEMGSGHPLLPRYERIAFEKALLRVPGKPDAAFLCPGHALVDVVLDLAMERYGNLLNLGAVLVDDNDSGEVPRVLFALEHSIQDRSEQPERDGRVISKRMLYVEIDGAGNRYQRSYAPYLDYRPLNEDDPSVENILELPELNWVFSELEQTAQAEAISHIVPEHLAEVRERREGSVKKTRAAVKARLVKEISHWQYQAQRLKEAERAGKPGARLNSQEATRRAEELEQRLELRMKRLEQEERVSALPPRITGGVVIIPKGLMNRLTGIQETASGDTQASAARARAIVMDKERSLGYDPTDREFEKLGYDIESRIPENGKLRFIEVKGRVAGASTLTVTKNEVLTALNKPDDFILAIVEFLDDETHKLHYVRNPFRAEPDWAATCIDYRMSDLIEQAEEPA